MLLQTPIYIRASSHRPNFSFRVHRVRNGQGIREVKQRVQARAGSLKAGDKGIIYCTSRASCKALALQLGCHYYHGDPEDPDADFLAQRELGYVQWKEGKSRYIVATAALGTGLDVAAIVHVIHLDIPHSIVDYSQEAGRAGRAGEPVWAEII
ncbi:hypothetical protein QQZ08_012559, partial [Neonectria magnoliae]